MTNTEAITKLTNIMHDDHYAWHPSILTAFNMAVDALKGAEGDLISRKEAIEVADAVWTVTGDKNVAKVWDQIKNLPSAQPTHGNTSNALKSLDCVDRQAAIDRAVSIPMFGRDVKMVAVSEIKNLPSAQPSFPQRHENDCINRQDAIEAINTWDKFGVDERSRIVRWHEGLEPYVHLRDVLTAIINLPSAQPEQRWIPCSERLPAYGEDVLISIGGYCNVGHIVSVNEEEQYNWYFSGWYHSPNDVDAWMPLPEPYREDIE